MPVIQGDKGDYITIKGRSGLKYFDENGDGFFIDGEMVVSEEYDFAIYIDSIEYLDTNSEPSDEIKTAVKKRLEKICLSNNFKVRFF